MSIRKGSPGRGASPRPDTFSYTPVLPGTKNAFTAFLAGPVYWAEEAHEHTQKQPGTKPCLHWLTEGALKCPRCRGSKPPTCIGWVPLYRELDTQPIIVIVHESASDNLLSLRWAETVLVGRVNEKSSVFVRRAENQLPFATNRECRKHPVDITNDLLTMWNIPELDIWLRRQMRPVEQPEDVPPVLRQRLSVPPPTTDTERAAVAANQADPSMWQQMVDRSLANVQKRKEDAEKNGVHKPEQTE